MERIYRFLKLITSKEALKIILFASLDARLGNYSFLPILI